MVERNVHWGRSMEVNQTVETTEAVSQIDRQAKVSANANTFIGASAGAALALVGVVAFLIHDSH